MFLLEILPDCLKDIYARMKGKSSYVPPPYVPLDQSELEADILPHNEDVAVAEDISSRPTQWTSGICACFDDMQSCMLLSALQPLIYQKEKI